jgi:hypothetical protein
MATTTKSRAGGRTHATVSFSDSINLVEEHIHWCPKGVSLLTKWYLAPDTEIEFAFEHAGERHCCVGIVVACHPLRQLRGFRTVIYFVETPCPKAHKAACDCKLCHEDPTADHTHFTIHNRALVADNESISRSRGARAAKHPRVLP